MYNLETIARMFILVIAIQYAILGPILFIAGHKGLGGSYLFYAIANVCIYFAALGV